ncbi:MAG: hypothetical protein V2I63_00425 [Pseudomonadales bacterium]|jgi:hypothetical protein|nr:hypothetical protein [Pseudomonadales bacterium]
MSHYREQGPWRRPRNTSADEKGGIHDDETARALGFEGGTVAGSIHMEQFPPFLVSHLGDAWLEDGSISLYFREATFDGQPVRCVGTQPEALGERLRMDIALETEAGHRVMEGTAALGGVDPDSMLERRLAAVRPAESLRVLADVVVDRWCEPIPVRIPEADIDRQLKVVTEPMAMFGAPGDPARVPPLSVLIHAMRAVEGPIAPTQGPFVGLFGAIEVTYLAGQPVTGRDYRLRGRARALSESPKTEIFWMESILEDAATGEPCVRMLKMDRIMKASSLLWADAGA